MYNDNDVETRNDVDALLALASKLHYLAATSDLSEVSWQTRENKTVYDGTGVALEALLALKWPGVPVEWLRDLWIDLLDVPTTDNVRNKVLAELYRDPAFDPSRHSCSYADQAVKDAFGEVPVGGWTDEIDAVWTAAHDLAYRDQVKQVERLASDMATPAKVGA
jgi:hypothetical protein